MAESNDLEQATAESGNHEQIPAQSKSLEQTTAKTNNSDMTVSQDPRQVFDFFGLPRELRNEIYPMLTRAAILCDGHDEDGDAVGLEVSVIAAPIAKLYTLCRQFKAEYEETFKHGMTIAIRDLYAVHTALTTAGWPLNISKAQITLLLACQGDCNVHQRCDPNIELRNHLFSIDELLRKLKDLKELRIKIYPCQPQTVNHMAMETGGNLLAQYVALPQTFLVEVYPWFTMRHEPHDDSDKRNAVEAYERKVVPDAVWTKKDGWQRK